MSRLPSGRYSIFGNIRYVAILAAPVYITNGTTRSVYLPSNTAWYGWYDDARYAGGQTVPLPMVFGTVSCGTLPAIHGVGVAVKNMACSRSALLR